ncbi:Rieske (2Fe-2S) domain-containing protein [Novosphingobium nitrogenifigens DSM 19370]|uniref:Rieske (2Fe-2S) domain-containing protein n=1 Tax=Novosphingobium nitrogenifigens DSM 19370 TaxID=983920 RepID=F1ZAG1_9SPHN|nr:aromatic ring-hydroxylating dioxygenase subunit alpha [Novosphingobium nitrogenifigens]EGD58431.1 Rieske (2Fe-2S) domain-containing protein [Novosphingobium nitrogenifigens DSM 19370]
MDLAEIKQAFATRRPGYSLPQSLYNDPAVFDFDLHAIYGRSWLMAGFACEVPTAGSYTSIKVGPWPVLIIRGKDGTIRAFHNSCRHRGAVLCKEGVGRTPRIVCPYHRWTYALDGELLNAPRMPDDFETATHGLRSIALEVVAGVIYICLADNPPAFDAFREGMEALLGPHDLENAKVARVETLVEYANWKLVLENGRECYHCQGSHPELSKTFPIDASAYFDYGGADHAARFEARMAELGLPCGPVGEDWWQALRFPLNPGMTSMTMDGSPASRKPMCAVGGGDIGSMRWALEPHSFAHATGEQVFFFSAMPTGPRETLVTAKWLVHKDAVEGVDYDSNAMAQLWHVTNIQDKDLAENNQAGVDSPGYTPGPYSPEAEVLVLRFVDWYCARAEEYLAEKLGSAKTGEGAMPHAA